MEMENLAFIAERGDMRTHAAHGPHEKIEVPRECFFTNA